MSEKSLEQQDIKKICLICGCHTNQAINIYEPRSGPNIIELIQAKFKFQPVNEDKFLCFSCNNWLINWHSLQVLNTKESDENHSSGKSRLNNSIPEEEPENNFDEMLSAVNNEKCKLYVDKTLSKSLQNKPKISASYSYNSYLVQNSAKKRKSFYVSRRFVSSWNKIQKSRRKSMQLCSACGHISLKLQGSLDKCKNCRKILKWRAAYYLKTIIEEQRRQNLKIFQPLIKPDEAITTEILQHYHNNLNLVTPIGSTHHQQYYNNHYHHQQNNMRNQRPLVDGKVVAMLRRLGTTLTREGNGIPSSSPIIMSPAKKKPQKPIWQQRKSNINPSEEDDILIDFNTVISEVLPMVKMPTVAKPQSNNTIMENIETYSDNNQMKTNLKEIYSKIPKCVTVSVINVIGS